ncbi:CoA transferase subunit A [Salipaludibacillus agaradhaerens]|uniref:CoA transferase subunit A n=1 Tax=Salipaludibacillus agaradhaerens TaxID=76935 RepID=UPI00099862DF|nr:CoA transferase subunit A [Salipaludibacillus agaradhaerens]
MVKVISLIEAVSKIHDGDTLMVGGFMTNGSPENLIDTLVERNIQNLTLICNDTGFINKGIGKLVCNQQLTKIITSHIGTNKETGRQMMAGETEVTLVPQGTLAEQIRAAGFGLGGVLTPTGIGTRVEDNKQTLTLDGKKYLVERPLKADIALLYASKVDRFGNIIYYGSTNNFNDVMASAATVTIVEAEEIVEVGEIAPHEVMTPGIFVDYIVRGGGADHDERTETTFNS